MPATRAAPVRFAVLGLAVAAVIASLPGTVAGVSQIPTGQTGQILDGNPITAIVGDIDGDGVRELITLAPRADDPVHLAVEVLEERPNGRVRSAGTAPLARVASVTEQLSGLPRPDEDNLLQARVDEPARLIAWHEGGRERVLVVAIGTLRNARACCLSIWAIERGSQGIRLRLMTDTMRSADQVWAVDMDADGTDELLTTEPRQDADPNILPIAVLRWTGERFEDQPARLGLPGGAPLVRLGDSDGRPGEEMGVLLQTRTRAVLHRIALGPMGRVRIDTASLPFGGSLVGIAGPHGGRLVLGDEVRRSVLLRWPAGGRLRTVGRSWWIGVPTATVGAGADVALVKVREDRLLDLFGPTFGSIRTDVTASRAEAVFRRAGVASYAGPLPGGTANGSPAYLFRGRLVAAGGGRRPGVTVTDMAAMPGMAPIGLFGRRAGRLALALPVALGVEAGLDAMREGGQLSQPAGRLRSTLISVADAATVLTPEEDDGVLQPHPAGQARIEAGPEVPTLVAGGPFIVPVLGPPGTRVRLQIGEVVISDRIYGSGQVDLRVSVDGYQDGDQLPATLLALTPSGQGYGSSWNVDIRTRPPEVSATTPFAPFSFQVGVSGRTAPDASVAVDGAPVPVAADGRFEAAVSAGLWPHDVQIVATDPFGNRNSATVSVVALLDYRRLPWIPIVALLTILAGIGLYLRVPHLRPAAPSGPMADATLEDLD
ncbi:MAG TPA: hypothetical protein VFY43_08120 [Candidatus Limnocylindria bacterium]|nr:hypothetical protein [Candidatus Limnocylindria bacterium]